MSPKQNWQLSFRLNCYMNVEALEYKLQFIVTLVCQWCHLEANSMPVLLAPHIQYSIFDQFSH